MNRNIALIALIVGVSLPTFAANKTVTLSVPGMTCAACPITVKKALGRVNGVIKTQIEYDKKEAVVTFDDTKTAVTALTKATADAGYPSKVATDNGR